MAIWRQSVPFAKHGNMFFCFQITAAALMTWTCKLCSVQFTGRAQLFTHYRLQHSQSSGVSPLPCLYGDCMCTFKTLNTLGVHLSRNHKAENSNSTSQEHLSQVSFKCPLCTFEQPFSESGVFYHLRRHLKNHETVVCPYKDCNHSTNVTSTFNSHKSKHHHTSLASDFCNYVTDEHVQSLPGTSSEVASEEDISEQSPDHQIEEEDAQWNTDRLKDQLKHNAASLFLKMQAILHVSNTATQEIVEHLNDIFSLSKPLVREAVNDVLQKCGHSITDDTLDEVVEAVMDSNVLFSATSAGAELSSSKRRKSFIERNYPLVKPVEYQLPQTGHTFMYVPMLQMIQELFKNTDILSKITESDTECRPFVSYRDGSYFKENELLSTEDLTLEIQLYADGLELANPLGTSRKIHKVCAVYWVLANVPPKYRSTLHNIQLGMLVKENDIKKYGYEVVLAPLLRDVRTLEQDGVFIESLGQSIKGTIFCVSADNLGAHGLGGFVESFSGAYVCRFCLATNDEFQKHEVKEGHFIERTKGSHDLHVQHVVGSDDTSNHFGVKGDCALRKSLQYFHPITGFPPDILHDLLEGVVPVELSLCIKELIKLKYFTLEYLNEKISSFPYQHTDKVDRPQPIPKTFITRGTIGGNGHENATVLRLLPLFVGNRVPDNDGAWSVLMDLKEVVELALCQSFTNDSLAYLQRKISDHRQTLQEVFPEFKLRPKHHYLEHYPALVRCFGPLVHVWTMRFEGKHRFFKKVVHDTMNFKNVLKTMATRHQNMIAYHLSSPSFFRPKVQTSRVDSVLVSTLPQVAQAHIRQHTASDTVYSTPKVTIDGIDYTSEMFLSVGHSGGLSKFSKIAQIYLVNQNVTFLCCDFETYYLEHLRSYELSATWSSQSVYVLSDLNDNVTFSAYMIDGVEVLTPKRFIHVKDN